MKSIILFVASFFIGNILFSQKQLIISQAIAYKVACYEQDNLDGYWLDVFGKKVFGQEYTNAKNSNDEFKLNKFKNDLLSKYAEGKKGAIGPIFYVTELIDNYSYDFSTSSVKIAFGTYDEFNRLTSTNDYDRLDVYTEGGVRRNWMTKGFESDDNPTFTIRNVDNIPTAFEMPVAIAEKSFAQRKGNNRPAFKLRYYFKFLQCGSGADVDVVKVELIDDIMNYKKAYEVEHYEPPAKPAKPVNGNDTVYYNSAGRPEDNKYSAATYRVITYVDGKISGTVKVYYMSGKFYTEAMYDDKTNDFNYDGLLTWYYETGTKFCEVTYADGVMNGKYMSWYSNGQKKEEVNFINNKKDGCDYMWDESGKCLASSAIGGWRQADYFDYYEGTSGSQLPVMFSRECPCIKRTGQNQSNNSSNIQGNSINNKTNFIGYYNQKYSEGEYKFVDGGIYYKSNIAEISSAFFKGANRVSKEDDLRVRGNTIFSTNIFIAGFKSVGDKFYFTYSTATTFENGELFEKRENIQDYSYIHPQCDFGFDYSTPSLKNGASSKILYTNFVIKDKNSDAIIQGFYRFILIQ